MERNQYPHTVYIVCGTQAEKADRNSVMVVKMSNLTKNFKSEKFFFRNSICYYFLLGEFIRIRIR